MGSRQILVMMMTALLLLPPSVVVAQDESPAPDGPAPQRLDGQVAGKDVVIVYDEGVDGFLGEAQPINMYASGETVWMVSAAEPALTEVFDKLP